MKRGAGAYATEMVTIAADKLQVGDGALMASAGKLNGIPMLIFYGLSDQLCMPAEALALKAKLGANVTLVPLQGGHVIETYDEVNHDMIVDFIETHAA